MLSTPRHVYLQHVMFIIVDKQRLKNINVMYLNVSFLLFFSFLVLHVGLGASGNTNFIYNGFKQNDLILDGLATIIMPDGQLRLTDNTTGKTSHAFYPDPIPFKQNGSVLSFSAAFVFGIVIPYPNSIGHGFVFVITPNRGLPNSSAGDYLGVFNADNHGNPTNHVVGVEFDTSRGPTVNDIDNNHVGIDINSIVSNKSEPARYFINNTFNNISLSNGELIQVWIEYDAPNKRMDVTLAPINITKPSIASLTLPNFDLSSILNDIMYIGFSSATGSSVYNWHYILGWSFALNGIAPSLNLSTLPKLPPNPNTPPPPPNPNTPPPPPPPSAPSPSPNKVEIITLPSVIVLIAIIAICFGVFYAIQHKKKFSEELEDWESEYGPHRFKYKDLYLATKGFKDKELVGTGGFGKVYKGTLPESNIEVAIKKVSHDSKQGMKEFVAEIVSMGRLRHRNLVQLFGYCRRKGELLLVYEYMPKGSLDKLLHQNDSPDLTLNWDQRFNIIKGVASGLFYLHEGWEQIVVHRDIKASNVLLDSELNARLGDFGLARLHDHGADPQTTHVMGTLGYMAPELSRTGKATPSSDVFAFGAFLLEVVCGRRPMDLLAQRGETMLVDKVFGSWKRGDLLRLVEPGLRGEYVEEEAKAMLKLGLLCSNVEVEERPTMREVVAFLDGVVAVPNLEGMELGPGGVSFVGDWKRGRDDSNDYHESYSTSANMFLTHSTSISESQLSEGR